MSQFDLFYTSYPRKVGKRAAELAFNRSVKRGNDPRELIRAATRFRDDKERQRKGIDFTPHPATWLNQDRHLDQPAQTPRVDTLFLGELDDVDDRPQCCIDAEHGFQHWLETHATPEEREKAQRLELGRTADAT